MRLLWLFFVCFFYNVYANRNVTYKRNLHSIDGLHNNDNYAFNYLHSLGLECKLGNFNCQDRKHIVRMHIETFWAFKFRYVVLLQNLQSYSKKG